MSGSDGKPRSSLFDALRDRSRVVSTDESGGIPHGLRIATAYSWRFLVVAAAIGVAIWLVIQLKLLVIPLLVAILVAALLWPAFSWMLRHRVPRWLAIVISLIGTIAIIDGPMHLSSAQIDDLLDQGLALVQEQAQLLWSGALAVGSTVGHVLVGAL